MGSTQQFCLKWNNHQSNMLSIFDQLLSSEHFVDVTLACDGLSVRAHKMVLSACSPFFQSLFIQNPCEHPIVILKDIRFVDLKALVQFMYRGEVNVSQDQLPTLLKAAEALKIKGLAEVTNESGSQKSGVPSVAPGLVGGPLGPTLGGGHSHNGHLPKAEQLQVAQLAQQQQPSVQAAVAVAGATPSPLAQSLAPAAAAAQNALVAAMQQNALKQAQLAAQAAQAAQERQNATSQSLSAAASMASHESNSNASTPLRQTDSPISQQNRKRRRKSASSEKGSGDEGSGVDSGADDNLDETRGNSDDESAGEEAEFEPSKLLEQSMTEVRQGAGHQDNNSSSSDNLTKEDIKPAISFDATAPNALAGLNTQDPTAVLAFAAAAQAAQGASGGSGDSVAGPSQPTHACYGIVQVPTGPWFCRKCESQERTARVRCELCPSREGALKRTDSAGGGWAHVVCALYIPEVRFGNVTTMEPIMLEMVPQDRYHKTCSLCSDSGHANLGACMQCNKSGCKQYFHVTCAQAAGLLCEEAGNYMDNVKYCGYCQHHYQKLKKDSNIKTIPAFKPPSSASVLSEDDSDAAPVTTTSTTAGRGRRAAGGTASGRNKRPAIYTSDSEGDDSAPTPPAHTAKPGGKSPPKRATKERQQQQHTTAASGSGLSAVASGPASTVSASTVYDDPEFDDDSCELSKVKFESKSRDDFKAAAKSKRSSEKNPPANFVSMYDSLTKSTTQKKGQGGAGSKRASKDVTKEGSKPEKESSGKDSSNITSTERLSQGVPPTKRPKTPSSTGTNVQSNHNHNNNNNSVSNNSQSNANHSGGSFQSGQSPLNNKAGNAGSNNATSTVTAAAGVSNNAGSQNNGTNCSSTVHGGSSATGKAAKLATATPLHGQSHGEHRTSAGGATMNGSAAGDCKPSLHGSSSSGMGTSGSCTAGGHLGAGGQTSAESSGPTTPLVGPQRPQRPQLPQAPPPTNFPTTLEQLLERQWDQGSSFLMKQAQHFDIAALLSCLHQLKSENNQLEDKILALTARKDHLLAVNARLGVPLAMLNNSSGSTQPSALAGGVGIAATGTSVSVGGVSVNTVNGALAGGPSIPVVPSVPLAVVAGGAVAAMDSRVTPPRAAENGNASAAEKERSLGNPGVGLPFSAGVHAAATIQQQSHATPPAHHAGGGYAGGISESAAAAMAANGRLPLPNYNYAAAAASQQQQHNNKTKR